MQIIEVRNDIFKLAYSPFQNGLLLSDFLLVSEGNKSVLAQVINIESSKEKDINIAALKGCLSVDETGKISSYIGFTPSTGAEVSPVTQEQVITMMAGEGKTIFWGYLAQHDNVTFKTESKLLANKPLILMDDYNNYNVIVNNFVHMTKQLGERAVIVDFDGSLQIDNAFYIKVGDDLKLPLSYNTLSYIYENDLKDESLSTQAVVQDIIIELQEYIKSLPEGFLPFSTIKNVIYSQYEENKIPELMLFKNKFVKYGQQDFLAETEDDFNFLNQTVAENDVIIIDASETDRIWHKLILNFISKEIEEKSYFIAKLENDNSDKQTILDIYNNHKIRPILAASFTHENVNVLKSIAENLILFPPNQLVNDFGTYTAFMQKLNRDEYVVCGENTLYLSFILRLTYTDTNMSPEYIEKEIQADVDKLYRAGAKNYAKNAAPVQNVLADEPVAEIPATKPASIPQPEPEEITIPEKNEINDEIITDDDLDFLDELDTSSDIEYEDNAQTIIEQVDNMPENIEPEIVEDIKETIPNDNAPSQEIIEETIGQEPQIDTENEQETIVENSGEEYSFDEDEELEQEQANIAQPREVKTELEESEAPENDEEITEDEDLEDEPLNQAPPIPIYSVPELEPQENIEFKEGNFVYHEKYGRGVIEKIMNYGTKTLCSIQFEEVGRRLLDPNLAGLKQV